MTNATANVIGQRREDAPEYEFDNEAIHDGGSLHEPLLGRERQAQQPEEDTHGNEGNYARDSV
ncbi:hypothetical protein D3C76_1536860 [compost metagenome]